jgi:DNA polymerase III epsilon subunit-like protein
MKIPTHKNRIVLLLQNNNNMQHEIMRQHITLSTRSTLLPMMRNPQLNIGRFYSSASEFSTLLNKDLNTTTTIARYFASSSKSNTNINVLPSSSTISMNEQSIKPISSPSSQQQQQQYQPNTQSSKPNHKTLIVFDTETNGIFKNRRMIELAWVKYDHLGNRLSEIQSHMIRPVGFYIYKSSTAIHNISHELAKQQGKDIGQVLTLFNDSLSDDVDTIVAYNLPFDLPVIMNEARIHGFNHLEQKLKSCKGECVMKMTNAWFGLKHNIKLVEACERIFGPINSQFKHVAAFDTELCAKLHAELTKLAREKVLVK